MNVYSPQQTVLIEKKIRALPDLASSFRQASEAIYNLANQKKPVYGDALRILRFMRATLSHPNLLNAKNPLTLAEESVGQYVLAYPRIRSLLESQGMQWDATFKEFEALVAR
jgi:hypothetical protein